MKTFTSTIALMISLASCANQWMGKGAALPEVVDKAQADIEKGSQGREYIGAKNKKERSEIEAKLMRAEGVKGTKAGDFHWAALRLLTQMRDVPAWATRISAEATVLTTDGLASWEQLSALPKEEKKKGKKAAALTFEGVTSKLEVTRGKQGEPWRISGVAIDIAGPRFAAFAEKKPFGSGAALSTAEANDVAFDAALLASAPPFDARLLVQGLAGAIATGDSRAFFLVAASEEPPLESFAARLTELSSASQEVQALLGEAPTFIGLPAGVVELKLALRGDNGQRLSYTIKKTKEGYRLTSLKARAKKDGVELDIKPMLSDPNWPNKKSEK
jgi:hypothetical protein